MVWAPHFSIFFLSLLFSIDCLKWARRQRRERWPVAQWGWRERRLRDNELGRRDGSGRRGGEEAVSVTVSSAAESSSAWRERGEEWHPAHRRGGGPDSCARAREREGTSTAGRIGAHPFFKRCSIATRLSRSASVSTPPLATMEPVVSVSRVRRRSPSWFTVDDGVAEEPLLLLGAPASDAVDDDDDNDQTRAALLRVEELEHLLGDVARRLSRLNAKHDRLEGKIAASSRGRRAVVSPARAATGRRGSPASPSPSFTGSCHRRRRTRWGREWPPLQLVVGEGAAAAAGE
uniref:Uncharacterized protein n=1 Tax=Oryza meridionalis TaxID=40149 RepID=A0A0E0CE95_9ORYZ